MTERALTRATRSLTRSPRRTDAVLAAALAIVSLVQVLVVPIAARPVGVLIALASTVPIALRRRHPVAATLAGTVLWSVPTDGFLVLGYVAGFFLFYSLAAEVADLRVVAAVLAFSLAMGFAGMAQGDLSTGEWIGTPIAVIASALVGRLMRHQHEQARRLRELNLELARERARAEHLAAGQERARIARELHDVVSHGVSVIAVQADAAEAALEHDPARAKAPLRAIRASASDALVEMRRMLGVLRSDAEAPESRPQPGLLQLEDLVARARAAGVDVQLAVEGAPRPLAPSLSLTAYRIVQEALTNARKHARGSPVRVRVAWRPGTVEVAVSDTGPGPTAGGGRDGHGLIGMRERARIHGGTLRAGAAPRGGYEVVAVLPTGAEDA